MGPRITSFEHTIETPFFLATEAPEEAGALRFAVVTASDPTGCEVGAGVVSGCRGPPTVCLLDDNAGGCADPAELAPCGPKGLVSAELVFVEFDAAGSPPKRSSMMEETCSSWCSFGGLSRPCRQRVCTMHG